MTGVEASAGHGLHAVDGERMAMKITLKFRLRDKHKTGLNKQARAVNVVWNYANETQKKAAQDRRKDFMHKAANAVVHEFGTIIVGDVSPKKLAKTRMAKSVYDAGWAGFKGLLLYKSMRNGGRVLEVSEAMSSQTCSACGCLPASRPTGIAGLGIRRWTCSDCGTEHDRDVNAAMNIARAGLSTLAEGALL